jgi:predicted Zn-dependent peptidase
VLLAACRTGSSPSAETTELPAAASAAVDRGPSVEDILATSDLPEVQEAPLAADPLGATVHRLSNGMTVYIATDRQAPSFYGWIAVRAGSRHDPPDSTGLAHYLEHMLLFKGSEGLGTVDHARERPHLDRIRALYDELAEAPEAERKRILAEIDAQTQHVAATAVPNEISRLYASLGVMYINAFTNKDRTVYVQRVPTNRFAAWAKVEVERFSRPVFRLFYPELEAVYEEKNRGLDSAWRPLWTLSNEGLFPEHPLGRQTTLGSVEHLKTPAFGNMVAFFERWYVPNNMAIVLAGDVDTSVLPALEDAFGGMEPRPLPDALPGTLPQVEGRIVKEFVSREEEVVEVSWRTTEAEHPDRAALAVLSTLISHADTGLLTTQLKRPAKVQWAYGDVTQYREAGSFSVLASPVPGQSLEELEALVRETVGSIETVTDAQVEAAKLDLEVRRAMDAESPYASVRRLVDAFVRHRDWSDMVAQDEAVKSVTRADVLAVAKRYLGDDSVVVFRRRGEPELPKISKPEITPLDLDSSRESEMAREIKALPASPLS